MCDAAHLERGETVLEIGPGTGALTKELLGRGMNVVAIETDERAVAILKETFANQIDTNQLQLHELDAREIPLEKLGLKDRQYAVVANIPYYLSGLLFRQLLETECQPHTLVFLVQKEVAARIARDQKESLLSLSIKAFGNPTYICTIGRSHFTPAPGVDSAIIVVTNITRDHFKTFSQKDFFTLLHLGFGQKRKQLLGNLSAQYDRAVVSHLFTDLNLPQTVRAEDIPLPVWLNIASELLPKTQISL